jgi:adenosylhomocysteine nucleosidase
MRSDAGRAVPGPIPQAARVAVIAALAVERACLDRAGVDSAAASVHQSGPGGARAAAAARAAVAAGADALVSWGLAGGLVAAAAPGSVVIPGRIVSDRGIWLTDGRWLAALHALLAPDFTLHAGALASVDAVLESPQAKDRAALATGAVAADMESAGIAAVAAETGLPFAAIRVVADGHADALPAGVEQWVDAAGDRKISPLLGVVLTPAQWPDLWLLARRYRAASRTLGDLAGVLGPRAFCRPGRALA